MHSFLNIILNYICLIIFKYLDFLNERVYISLNLYNIMQDVYFKVKKLDSSAIVPSKREEDAGYDFYGLFDSDYQILRKNEICMIPTGLSMEFSKNWVLFLAERGSTGSKGISRRCGVVDSGFRGELKIMLNNTSSKIIIFLKEGVHEQEVLDKENLIKEDVTFYSQSKAVAQGMLLYCPHVEVEEVDELDQTSQRGDGMLGSSQK